MEVIRSRQNLQIKSCAKLIESRRERLKTGRAVLDGIHLIEAALDAGMQIERVLVAESASIKPEIAILMTRCDGVSIIDDALFRELSDLDSMTGVLAILAVPKMRTCVRQGWVLALDTVQDPGNVGSLMRTAVAAGVDQIWLGEGCADIWSPKVLRAGMGAHFSVDMVERVDLPTQLKAFGGDIAITGLDGSRSLYESNLTADLVLVLGNEGQGVSMAVRECADVVLKIPMAPGIESLNVGAAGAICMYERVRQHAHTIG
ncbi:RNA methyltransferase [Burkholderiaceae bacterium DAT-1]|nr:RNA methyltransferase [Burkholderiaceae bacterium DAT-1]